MRSALKMIGSFLVISLLTIHLLVITLLMAPAPKLIDLAIPGGLDYLHPHDIPKGVRNFIESNKIEVKGNYQIADNSVGRLISRLIRIKHNRFMDYDEQLALNMNLLDFGKGVIGMRAAAEYYYGEPLKELSDQEWLTLINLQKIFSKK